MKPLRLPLILSLLFFSTLIAQATLPPLTVPPPGGYDSGSNSILDPGCAPNTLNCWVNLPGGGSVTADNGLTATGTNVQLGGTLLQDTVVDQGGHLFSLNNITPSGLTTLFQTDNNGITLQLAQAGGARSVISWYDAYGGINSPKINIYSSGRINPINPSSDGYTSININPSNFSIQSSGTNDGYVTASSYDFSLDFEKGITFGPLGGSHYTFPLVDGTAGQVLTTDGLGQLSWVAAAGGGSSWSLTGNAGTTAGANFIGTTDTQDFVVKTNGVVAAKFGQVGNVELGQDYLGFLLKSTSTGVGSMSWGTGGEATKDYSTVFGINNLAHGDISTVFGESNEATGNKSTAFGFNNHVDGYMGTVFGRRNYSTGDLATAFGRENFARSYAETAFGYFGSDYTALDTTGAHNFDRLLAIGNGNTGTPHNAYTLFKDGSFVYNDDNFQNDDLGTEQNMFYFNYGNHDGAGGAQSKRAIRMGSVLNDEYDIASTNVGNRSIAIGFQDENFLFAGSGSFPFAGPVASGDDSFAIGTGTVSSGGYSMAVGHGAQATNTNAHAFGFGSIASGIQSTAIGPLATAAGEGSTAVGVFANAVGDGSLSIGNGFAFAQNSMSYGLGNAYSLGETNIGMRNTSYTPVNTTSWNLADRLFSIGGGDANAFNPAPNASDALTILKNGQTGIGIDNFEAFTNGNIFQVGDGNTGIIGYVDNGTGNWVAVSDERKKENITDLSYGLNELIQLRPTAFDYKRNHEHTIGFIAQQVLPIIPEAVYGTENEGYGMSYVTLTPVIVKAIQELNLKVDTLQLANGTTSTNIFDSLKGWLGDVGNGVEQIFAKRFIATEELCVDSECFTANDIRQLRLLVNQQQNSQNPVGSPSSPGTDSGVPTEPLPPVITCNEPQVLNSTGDTCIDPVSTDPVTEPAP